MKRTIKFTVALVLLYIAWHRAPLTGPGFCHCGDTALFNSLCPPLSSALTCWRHKLNSLWLLSAKQQSTVQWTWAVHCLPDQTTCELARICTASTPGSGSFLFTPGNKFSLLSAVVVFWKGSCSPALLNQQICRTLDSQLHAQHPKENVLKKLFYYWGPRLAEAWHVQYASTMNNISPASKRNISQ